MRTLGIDLAAQAKDTAYCVVQWYADLALVETPVQGADDEALLSAMEVAAWTGIDAAFGWPEPFVVALGHYLHFADWPAGVRPEHLRLRETDRFVRDVLKTEQGVALMPLSVSSSWLATCAWRCAALLRRYQERTGHELNRIAVPVPSGMDGPPDKPRGSGLVAKRGVVEVYPAAALAMWGLGHRGYKAVGRTSTRQAHGRREAIVRKLETEAGGWLLLAKDVRAALVANDHCLDAFVAALVACAAASDRTIKPMLEQRGLAHAEGWIHLPTSDSLRCLTPGGV